MEKMFWASLFIVFYTFVGYGVLLYLLVLIRRLFKGKRRVETNMDTLPTLTLVVASYNEADILREKINNTLDLNYPKEKLSLLFVTDGSSDGSERIIEEYPQLEVMHSPERRGKIHAIHRAMKEVQTDVVVFTDANTFLNKDSLINIARHYADPSVGCVSGEKRVKVDATADATAGEGFYWRYESKLKQWDSELYSVVGAAGELFSIRRFLYEPVQNDTVLDDFMISLLIAQKGYRIVYEPDAYAVEESSANIKEELKRKVRIAAGGIQSILRLNKLFNPIKYPVLTFQYISHRVLRWTVTPFLMILVFFLNILLVNQTDAVIYQLLMCGQVMFYGTALIGLMLEQRKMKIKLFFIPYYFCIMNYAVIAGINRYFRSGQSAVWEKAKRKAAIS
ncbi:MAG: glycosyltransferase family 2 protein [Sphingobacteriales bacterium]|nr:MAG: glycosyltransferase family 2 protein [Sphingobacteriales bacterium]